jgi:hypothetical protein
VRARVEHVFGAQLGDMGGTLMRTIGMVRAKAKIGMKNLAYNEEGKELIRGINSPTNATPRPVAPHQPVPGVTPDRRNHAVRHETQRAKGPEPDALQRARPPLMASSPPQTVKPTQHEREKSKIEVPPAKRGNKTDTQPPSSRKRTRVRPRLCPHRERLGTLFPRRTVTIRWSRAIRIVAGDQATHGFWTCTRVPRNDTAVPVSPAPPCPASA